MVKTAIKKTRQRVTSLAQFYGNLLLIYLVILGIFGAGYHIFKPHGWAPRVISALWQKGALYTLFILVCVFAAFALFKHWLIDDTDTRNKNWITYLCAGAGLFFSIKLITTGSL
jgi:amino acid permease